MIIVSGLAEITVGCISIWLGGYLAGQTEVDHYDSELKRGHAEIDNMPLIELQEVEDILTELGIEKSLNKHVALQVSRDKNR